MPDSAAFILPAFLLIVGTVLLLASLGPTISALFRVWRDWARGRSRSRDVLELAIRLRLRVFKRGPAEFTPRFWANVELDTMPERQMLNICAAYADLRTAGLSDLQTTDRLEVWRSRFGVSHTTCRATSACEYLRHRVPVEYPGLKELTPLYYWLVCKLFRRHAIIRAHHRRVSLLHLAPSLKRLLYTVRIEGHDVSLIDCGQPIAIGWTDLERYLESDTIAVRVLDGDEIWSYSSPHSAGLALVRRGQVLELSELANFRHRKPNRKRPNGAHGAS